MTVEIDRERLQQLAKQVNSGVILELGSKNGLSARSMALFSKVAVYCIDMWDLTFLGDKRPDIHLHDDEEFKRMIKDLNVVPVKGLSSEIAKVWDKPIGLLFIDGDHTYKGCKADYDGFAHHIIKGGYLVFHDYENRFPGVAEFVNEIKSVALWTGWELGGVSVISARRLR